MIFQRRFRLMRVPATYSPTDKPKWALVRSEACGDFVGHLTTLGFIVLTWSGYQRWTLH